MCIHTRILFDMIARNLRWLPALSPSPTMLSTAPFLVARGNSGLLYKVLNGRNQFVRLRLAVSVDSKSKRDLKNVGSFRQFY